MINGTKILKDENGIPIVGRHLKTFASNKTVLQKEDQQENQQKIQQKSQPEIWNVNSATLIAEMLKDTMQIRDLYRANAALKAGLEKAEDEIVALNSKLEKAEDEIVDLNYEIKQVKEDLEMTGQALTVKAETLSNVLSGLRENMGHEQDIENSYLPGHKPQKNTLALTDIIRILTRLLIIKQTEVAERNSKLHIATNQISVSHEEILKLNAQLIKTKEDLTSGQLVAAEQVARVNIELQQACYVSEKQGAEIARLKQEAEIARLKQEEEIARLKQEAEIARLKQEAEIARLKKEAEVSNLKQQVEIDKLKQEIRQPANSRPSISTFTPAFTEHKAATVAVPVNTNGGSKLKHSKYKS